MLWAGVALAVFGALLGAAPERAAADEETDGYFSDDDGSVHEPALEALASQGVLAGVECGEGLICPSEPLKRWEMAVWLVRVLDGAEPSTVDTPSFSDVDYDAWWAPFVERLSEMGITVGCRRDPLQYCPYNPVTRAQMATFLKRAFDLEPAPSAGFIDVSGGSHAANIDALAAAGITVGCSRDPLQYCPARSVNRGQMASFLARALGLVELPAEDVVTQVPNGRFKSVSAGSWHSCGLRVDETVVCWGSHNRWGETDSPGGAFAAVSAGEGHACGIRKDGTAVCWGRNSRDQARAPAGRFSAITAGNEHSCGVRLDSTTVCWGYETIARPAGVRSPYAEDRPDPAACRVFAAPGSVSAGFPRHRLAAPATGTVRVAVLFMDFPDATASYSTRDETGESLKFAERYLEEASYGALDLEFVPLHRWLRSEHEHTHYLVGYRLQGFDSEAARVADARVDFSQFDILMTVLPSQHFSGGTAVGPVSTDEGIVGATVRINSISPMIRFGGESTVPLDWGRIAAHELLHALGLADLYRIGGALELIEEPPGKLRFGAHFGIMGLGAYFLLDEDDPRMHTYFPGSAGVEPLAAWLA